MTELKTLKDLYEFNSMIDGKTGIFREELKQEAIKWVKELQQPFTDFTFDDEEVVKWIKHFFNITEE